MGTFADWAVDTFRVGRGFAAVEIREGVRGSVDDDDDGDDDNGSDGGSGG